MIDRYRDFDCDFDREYELPEQSLNHKFVIDTHALKALRSTQHWTNIMDRFYECILYENALTYPKTVIFSSSVILGIEPMDFVRNSSLQTAISNIFCEFCIENTETK